MSSPKVVSSASSDIEVQVSESPFFSGQVRGLCVSTLDASARMALRGKLESTLHFSFQEPLLIDGLTDYLSEVAAEDPQYADALGV